jgi:hypothetical protein
MIGLGDGWSGYLMMLAIAVLVHEPWRWAGYALGRRLDPNDEIFKWVKLVSTALVAALATRLLLFPAGALAGIPLWLRIGSFAVALAVFYHSQMTAWQGVCAGAAMIAMGKLAIG